MYVHLMVGCESENGEVRMKTQCAECGRPFWAVKNWQRFCCTKHKDDFNNRKKKRTKALAAEREREHRLEGGGSESTGAPRPDLPTLQPFVARN